jgi:pectate lyase
MRAAHAFILLNATLASAAAGGLASYLKNGLASWDLEGYALDNPIGPTTGGKGGKKVTVSTAEEFLAAVTGSEPRIIYVKGHLALPERASIGSNKSILGVGKSALITGNGFTVNNVDNIIIRNLKISRIYDNDAIGLRNTTRVWIDHNEFESDFGVEVGPDTYDGQIDIVRASDWVTVSWNYLHDHWKSSLVGNDAAFRDIDFGHLHITYHHNYWKNEGTRGPAGRFGHQHIYNNLYEDFHYQALHSRSDNQMLVEGNVFRGDTREALSTHGLVIPEDSPNTCVCGDEELDGYANLGASKLPASPIAHLCQVQDAEVRITENDWGPATINITQVGDFTKADYKYKLTPLWLVQPIVKLGAGIGRV